MNSTLVSGALSVIPSPQMLVNVVRLRVKQLTQGHRPLIETAPGLGIADIALTEIIHGKLKFESTGATTTPEIIEAKVVEFPAEPSRKKRAA
ncbi:MAG: DNA-directed RNA polymerase subunit omega [Verrucomicrobiota bacterium]|nr:DNA-directed RNA polymerase subunit omega [Verrucomicrobiota bacterium]